MLIELGRIVSRKKILVICHDLNIYTRISNIIKKKHLKIEIYPYAPPRKEFGHEIVVIVEARVDKKLVINHTATLYTFLSTETSFLLDLTAALKKSFIRKVDVGIDPGLNNIGIAVVADGILVIGETLTSIYEVLSILEEIAAYIPLVSRIMLKIGNGENYRILLNELLRVGEKNSGRFSIEVVDEAQARKCILSIKSLRDRNVIDALKILACKGYRRVL